MRLLGFFSHRRGGSASRESAACYAAWVERGKRPSLDKPKPATILKVLAAKAGYWLLSGPPTIALEYCDLFFQFARRDDTQCARLINQLIDACRRERKSPIGHDTSQRLKDFLGKLEPSTFPADTEVDLLLFGIETSTGKERYACLNRIAELGDPRLVDALHRVRLAATVLLADEIGLAIANKASKGVVETICRRFGEHAARVDSLIERGDLKEFDREGSFARYYLGVGKKLDGVRLAPLVDAHLRSLWRVWPSIRDAERYWTIDSLIGEMASFLCEHPYPPLEPVLLDILAARIDASSMALSALSALGQTPANSEEMRKRVFEILDNPRKEGQSLAFAALMIDKTARLVGECQLRIAIPHLLSAARFDWKAEPHTWERNSAREARAACLHALGSIGGDEALDYLLTCLPTAAAVYELARHKDRRAVEPLMAAYRPTHYGGGSAYSELIVWALGMIGDVRGASICHSALHDEVVQVRIMGLLAMRELVGAEQAAKEDTAYGGDVLRFGGREVYEGRKPFSTLFDAETLARARF